MTQFWRVAGLSYVKYVDIASNVLRNAVREDVSLAIRKRGQFYYKKVPFQEGAPQEAREFRS